jgi:hypothetical protein
MITFSTVSTDPNIALVSNYLQRLTNSVTQLQNQVNYGSTFIFNNANLTPQQAIAYFGTNGGALLQFINTATAYLSTVTGVSTSFTPIGWAAIPKQDGTVTLTPPLSTGNPVGQGSLSI